MVSIIHLKVAPTTRSWISFAHFSIIFTFINALKQVLLTVEEVEIMSPPSNTNVHIVESYVKCHFIEVTFQL